MTGGRKDMQLAKHGGRSWQCKAFAFASLGMLCAVIVGTVLGTITEAALRDRLDDRFAAATSAVSVTLQSGIDSSLADLGVVAALFTARCPSSGSPFVSRASFDTFAGAIKSTSSQLQALEFVPRVTGESQRAQWESAILAEYGPELAGLGIKALDESGQFAPAPANSGPYFPIVYVSPVQGRAAAVMLDSNSSPERADTMHRAAVSGAVGASGILPLVQRGGEPGVLVFYPVYACNATTSYPSSPTARDAHEAATTYGFALAVVRVQVMLAAILQHTALQYPDLWLGVAVGGQPVFAAGASASGLSPPRPRSSWATRHRIIDVEFGDATWQLAVHEVDAAWIESAVHEVAYAYAGPIVLGIAASVAVALVLRSMHINAWKLAETAVEAAERTHQYMVTYVCHELRNPLHACLSHLELLLQEDGQRSRPSSAAAMTTSPSMHSLDSSDAVAAQSAAKRMAAVLDEVVDMNRSWGTSMGLHPVVVDSLTSVIRDAANRYRMLVDPAVKLLLDVDADLPACYIDAAHFRQVVGRGLQLAANATSSGSIWVKAGLLPAVSDVRWLLCEVRYNGTPRASQLAWSRRVAESEGYQRLQHITQVAEEVVASGCGQGVTSPAARGSGPGADSYWMNSVQASQSFDSSRSAAAAAATTSRVLRAQAGQSMQLDLCWTVTQALGGVCGVHHDKSRRVGSLRSCFWVCVPLHSPPPQQLMDGLGRAEGVMPMRQQLEVAVHMSHKASPAPRPTVAASSQSIFAETPSSAVNHGRPQVSPQQPHQRSPQQHSVAGHAGGAGQGAGEGGEGGAGGGRVDCVPEQVVLEAKPALPPLDPTRAMVVAVVDDEPMLRKICKRFLKKAHVKCVLMPDGVDLLSAMLQEGNTDRITVILLDIVMHKSNGVTVCKSLRDAGVTLPIFAMTANVDSVHRQAYAEAGFSGVLAKPFSSKEMHECLGLPPPKTSRRKRRLSAPAIE